ncbi:16S rRNA (uracil(1498)-N(3))-methyltransferase [Desulfonatronovibrio magnus]|uniref:16S rRNA (uracil(1498)-N(3))-methyltransferase n=1 Tax=Desulfonatronovibrio magnus TaxID=698827 RepID=UPI0005EAE5FB|nr:16S rRNA (uracil(1498)-N(3))-methyltransferase [Desulfonatronovibrio magnus]
MYKKIHNFYLAPDQWHEPYLLKDQEARHLSKVLRIKEGVQVRLINGEGRTGLFIVQSISKNQVLLKPVEFFKFDPPVDRTVLALAWNKSFRRSWMMEKAVELGVWKILLWQARHSQGSIKDARSENWQGKIIAAGKQCENPWLPQLSFLPDGALEVIDTARAIQSKILLWEEETENSLVQCYQDLKPMEKIVVVGPEGGLDPSEVEAFIDAGFQAVSLGPRVLRWETAALAPLYLEMLFNSSNTWKA